MSKVKLFVFLFIAVIVATIVSSLFSSSIGRIISPIKFQEFGINQVSQVLTVLILVALFFERALEVFVLTFRKLGEQNHESNVKNSSLQDERIKNQKTLDDYKDETRRITLWAALLGGILISIVGVRGLESFVILTNTNNWQSSFFRVLDILLTGSVIAGGSDAIHKILQAFTTFMDAAAASNKAQAATVQAQANTAQLVAT